MFHPFLPNVEVVVSQTNIGIHAHTLHLTTHADSLMFMTCSDCSVKAK